MPFGDWSVFEMRDLQTRVILFSTLPTRTGIWMDMGFNTAQQVHQVLAWVNHKEVQFRLASLITLVCRFGHQEYGEDEPS